MINPCSIYFLAKDFKEDYQDKKESQNKKISKML
jgi:hypothetical protein